MDSKSQIQTMFGRVWSTVLRSAPLALNAIIITPRGGPETSALAPNAEELDASAYSSVPSSVGRSLQILGEFCSTWKTCERVVEQENWLGQHADPGR